MSVISDDTRLYIVAATKTEGGALDTYLTDDATKTRTELRESGYVVFYVARASMRNDDIAGVTTLYSRPLSDVSTASLRAELSRREGVSTYEAISGDYADIGVERGDGTYERVRVNGPAIVTIHA